MRRLFVEIPEDATVAMRVDATDADRPTFAEWAAKHDALVQLDPGGTLRAHAEPREGVRVTMDGPAATKTAMKAIAAAHEDFASDGSPPPSEPYKCDECGYVDDLATPGSHPLCSQCDPKIGAWHGLFARTKDMPVTDLSDVTPRDDTPPPEPGPAMNPV